MEKVRETAFNAAHRAGAILRERLGNIKNIGYKDASSIRPFNIVTDVDKESEQVIIEILRLEFPDDQILAEETGFHARASSRRWLVDPLDGTSNYTHTYPFFCVSIAFEDRGKVLFGAVYNPIANEMFWAEDSKGAWLNESPISVSKISALKASLLATGFPTDTEGSRTNNMTHFITLTNLSHGVRRDGSAALDLCFVASGRLDGFWELKLAPWDLGAGTLIVREAGGRITNLLGGSFDLNSGHVLATNGLIHEELVTALSLKLAPKTTH